MTTKVHLKSVRRAAGLRAILFSSRALRRDPGDEAVRRTPFRVFRDIPRSFCRQAPSLSSNPLSFQPYQVVFVFTFAGTGCYATRRYSNYLKSWGQKPEDQGAPEYGWIIDSSLSRSVSSRYVSIGARSFCSLPRRVSAYFGYRGGALALV